MNSNNISFSKGSINPEEIIASLKKKNPTMNILLYASLFMILVGIICDVFILKHLFVTIVISIWVIVFMAIYLGKLYLNKKNLKDIDLDKLREEISNGCISFPKIKTYFTNNYIISNYYHASVIKYSDIIWMYPINKYYSGAALGTDLIIRLNNKKKEIIKCYDIIVEIITNQNPNILFGFTFDNKKKYVNIIKNK